jgi:hypothetical protein
MAAQLPKPLKRREILYGPITPPETLIELGRAYEQEGRLDDALQFFEQARDRAGLERMKAAALRDGNAFILKRVAKCLPELVTPADWEALIAKAEELGLALYAEQGRAAIAGHLEASEPEEKKGLGKS